MKVKQKEKMPQGTTFPGGSLPNSPNPKNGPGQTRSGDGQRLHAYPVEVRRRAVQLHLEEGLAQEAVAREIGVSTAVVAKWVRQYREHGEAGLQNSPRGPHPKALPEPVRQTILALKTAEPQQSRHLGSYLNI